MKRPELINTFNDISKAAYDAGLSVKELSKFLDKLDEAAKRGSESGESLRVQILNV